VKIDPETAQKIAQALADGSAVQGPRAVIPFPEAPATLPMPSVELHKPSPQTRVRKRASMRESEFQLQVIEYAQIHKWRVAHFRPGRVLRGGKEIYETPIGADGRGFPDLLMLRGERAIVAELKIPPNDTTPEQDDWLKSFNAAHVTAVVWRPDDWPEIERVLR